MHAFIMTADKALKKLKEGNEKYLHAETSRGNISRMLRKYTHENGQHPYAIIITCSDSRVIPESIFSAGLGDLFVIRVAGNVIDDHQLGSIVRLSWCLDIPFVVRWMRPSIMIRKDILSTLQMKSNWPLGMKKMISKHVALMCSAVSI